MLLEAVDIQKSFEGKTVLRGVSLSVAEGEIAVLLGPSGCGKTTFLRIIAGLETCDDGTLYLEGKELSDVPVHQRGFGMVFQDFALFPHKNVAENVAFGLRMQNWGQERQRERVSEVLQLVGLAGFENRQVFELSGGEQQRVALARSLAPSPRVLLLDEPLGSLDRALRERLMGDLRTILKSASGPMTTGEQGISNGTTDTSAVVSTEKKVRSGMTSIYVTHDQEEAFAIADRIFVMNQGRIEQVGRPYELYRHPKNSFVARFMGMDNLLRAVVVGTDPLRLQTSIGEFDLGDVPVPQSEDIQLLIRPEAATIAQHNEDGLNKLEGLLSNISFRGRHRIVTVEVGSDEGVRTLKFTFDTHEELPSVQSIVKLRLKASELMTVRS